MKSIKYIALGLSLLLLQACPSKETSRPETEKIGSAIWTTKNLSVDTFRNGEKIPEARSNEEWQRASKKGLPAWCYYENDPKTKFGRLYNWSAVNDSRGLAPTGWHIPTKEEWDKAEKTFPKNNDLFSWQRGGFRHLQGNFRARLGGGYWWTATQTGPKVTAYSRRSTKDGMPVASNAGLGTGMSIRLVKD